MNIKKTVARLGILVFILVIGGFFYLNAKQNNSPAVSSKTDLDRPLIVGIVSWPGYSGGITANRGFQENLESIFTKKYGLPVRFVLVEDIDARGKAFAKGGPKGVDVVWTTVDFWANELPNFVAGGIDGKAFFQVDWSQGGDAIVGSKEIHSIEDLKDKKIALVEFTPSHWLLETALRNSKLSESERQQIRNNLIFTQDVPSARAAFVAEQVDAAVVWEPDTKQALKRDGAHVLLSTKDLPNIIADVMVAKQEFLNDHPKAIEAFIRGWLDGVSEATSDPISAATYLVQNEPLFEDLGIDETKQSLSWVKWPTLEENADMFGLDGSPSEFDTIFIEASTVWKDLGLIETSIDPKDARDTTILQKIYEESTK